MSDTLVRMGLAMLAADQRATLLASQRACLLARLENHAPLALEERRGWGPVLLGWAERQRPALVEPLRRALYDDGSLAAGEAWWQQQGDLWARTVHAPSPLPGWLARQAPANKEYAWDVHDS